MMHAFQSWTSKAFNFFISKYLKTGVKDNLGGFFAIHAETVSSLNAENIFQGHGDYFIRLILEAKKNKYDLIEIPTVYRLRFSGKPTRSRLWMLKNYLETIRELKNVE